MGNKDKVKGLHTKQLAKLKKATSNSTTATRRNQQDRQFEKGGPGKDSRKDDPLAKYRDKELMIPSK